jgi:hypothetical protein
MIGMPQPLWAYLGPETTLPLFSVLGAILGGLLMFWQFIVGSVKKFFRLIFRKGSVVPTANTVPNSPLQVLPPLEEATVGGAPGVNGTEESAV